MTDDTEDSGRPPVPPGEEPRTIFAPFPFGANDPAGAPPPIPPTSVPGAIATGFTPREVGQAIRVGDVLNHIFEVRRFIARGGMGEVFEGVNVNTDERVAIKVMLPSLAADPNVIGMFRKEARTLTRLQHHALVSYRVLAQEPQLGVLYIVTEFVDGDNLSEVLDRQRSTPAALTQLLRRLASALRAAHQLGAIHRDIAPDNVILEGGELGRAKIIDFGIAKDLDPGSNTIVGDGFAGKLNYVAPEQLGDFGREIGPWTDVYSLALVILAVALGRDVPMGGTLVDAVDKRRALPDLSAAPAELRPVLTKMLAPNPADRMRSMDEVLDAIAPRQAAKPAAKPGRVITTPWLIGGGVGVAAIAGALFLALGSGRTDDPVSPDVLRRGPVASDPVETARNVVNTALPSVNCTWLDISGVTKVGDRVAVALIGVAGDPASAQREISEALAARAIRNADLDFESVATITPSGCAALDAYRQIRAGDTLRLSVLQRKFELATQPPGQTMEGRSAANELIEINLGDATTDFTLLGIEPSGRIVQMVLDRASFEAKVRESRDDITPLGDNRYRMKIVVDHPGWSGFLLIRGKGPFPVDVVAPPVLSRGPTWLGRFVDAASRNGWRTEMVWARAVDEVREGALPTPPPAAAPSSAAPSPGTTPSPAALPSAGRPSTVPPPALAPAPVAPRRP